MINLEIAAGTYGIRPRVDLPDPRFLDELTEAGMRKLISDQYDLLRKSPVANLFPENEVAFEQAKLHSSDFFIQICGGHPHYHHNRGNPLLVRRHMPFTITPEARIIWLKCYQQLLPKLNVSEELILSFWNYLNYFSMWMVNARSDK